MLVAEQNDPPQLRGQEFSGNCSHWISDLDIFRDGIYISLTSSTLAKCSLTALGSFYIDSLDSAAALHFIPWLLEVFSFYVMLYTVALPLTPSTHYPISFQNLYKTTTVFTSSDILTALLHFPTSPSSRFLFLD